MVYEDQGSGVLVDLSAADIPSAEHTPAWSLGQGVDVVSFSGDKLLGASQAGVILGSAELVGRIKKNPLMRALRPDKLTLAGLEATLRDYLDADGAWGRVPVLTMLSTPADLLRERACALFDQLLRAVESLGACVDRTAAECAAGGAQPLARVGRVTLRVAADVSYVGEGPCPPPSCPAGRCAWAGRAPTSTGRADASSSGPSAPWSRASAMTSWSVTCARSSTAATRTTSWRPWQVSSSRRDPRMAASEGVSCERGAEVPVIVGTAGHVDHGKSSLVLRMTGTDPDRLPQEKARGHHHRPGLCRAAPARRAGGGAGGRAGTRALRARDGRRRDGRRRGAARGGGR